jgi:putative transposase
MRILQIRAGRGWSICQTAKRFLVTEETIMSWVRRIDEEGESALVRVHVPVNKFPDYVGYLVRYLKLFAPALGKLRIAQMLARAGLHLSASTVGRMLKRTPTKEDVAFEEPVAAHGRTLRAKHPNHIWHVDLTAIPTGAGFWVPWVPFAKPQSWPFCWWAAIALDHTSRLVLGVALFMRRPNSVEVCAFLGRAIKAHAKPRYIISDQGMEFRTVFKAWCRKRYIRPRKGAIGKHGSTAIIERLIRSMKSECTRRILVPLRLNAMRSEVGYYATWYNQHRPHSALDGRTPSEVYRGAKPANEKARFEPRPAWPRSARSDVPIKGKPGVRLTLVLRHVEKRAHLPVVELKRAA